MFNKFGELLDISPTNIQSVESVMAEFGDAYINERFSKFAAELRKVSPKAKDFLYFTTRYITAAEAVLINADGSSKLDRYGKTITASWEPCGNSSIKWVCSDPTLKPFKNNNGDIFPESELLKAHKKWVERPLCVDHKSDSVDAVRGIILDSYYDRVHKYAVALIALDAVSFPQLANGIKTGYKTSVSMGTRVARAVCFDCGQAATTEHEFCHHMKTRSCYGEVNTGLDPIEISIVVSGADPHAKIRTILAAANTLRNSVEEKEQEIKKLSISQASTDKFKELEEDLHKMSQKLADLKTNLEQDDTNQVDNKAYGQTGDYAMKETELPNTDQSLNLPARLATSDENNNALESELQDLRNSVNSKFQHVEERITALSHKIKEEIMTVNSNSGMNKEGYFQGAGGVNEPTPGKAKYPVEPQNAQLREHGDKHMVSAVNTGPVEGMFPGDKEKKELVQRAEIEERALRRSAALQKAKENLMKNKEAYFQGGGEGNEPTPGKAKYPVDPLDGKDRNKEDKQMVGQKPFPGVGDVDGLHPSPASAEQKDELARKKLLQRASLKARFVRVAGEDGAQDLGQSAWEVSRDGEVLFTATVDEISSGNVEGLYDVVASKEFGTKLLEKVYKVGADKASQLYKNAQAVSGMDAMPAMPEAGGPAPVPAMPDMSGSAPAAESAMEASPDADGDPKATALKLAEEMRDRASDLLEAVRVLTGDQAEMGDLEGLATAASGEDADQLKQLIRMKKAIGPMVLASLKKSVAELNEGQEELNLLADMLDSGADAGGIVEEAITDAKSALADTHIVMETFIKYARGSEQITKRANMLEMPAANADDAMVADEVMTEEEEMNDAADMLAAADEVTNTTEDEDMNEVMMDVDPTSLQGKKVEIKASDLETKESRAELRAKLAAQAVEFSSMLDEANKLADGQTQLDVKPSGNLGRVETLEEQHKAMLDVAEAPPKVRKEAARLNELIAEGKVAKADLDQLVAQGLDSEVVKYWKQFYGQAGKEGSEFANELLKTHAQEQINEAINTHKVKIARAYELANEMVRRGIVADERAAITAQVEDMMTWNDEGFEAMKRVVNKHSLKKAASTFPQVGVIGSGDPVSSVVSEFNLQDALDQAFANRRF